MRKLNLVGQRFQYLVVIGEASPVILPCGQKNTRDLCRCDCGKIIIVRRVNLRAGRTIACGCRSGGIIHRHASYKTHTPTYRAWDGMLQRCNNSNNPQYRDYGGRGIAVCDRWQKDFRNFLTDMGEAPRGLSIDRINNNGDYEPGNCRWATRKQQIDNRRISKKYQGDDIYAG